METVGIRGTVGTWGWDIEVGPFTGPAAEVLERQAAVVAAHPRGGLVEGWVTLVGHDLASDDLLSGAADLARHLGTGLTMHMSPTSSDPDAYLARTGRRPIVHLRELGVLGPHLLLAHGVWLDDDEVEAILASRSAVAYCPWAYLRLGQGVSRVGRHAELVERGGRVACPGRGRPVAAVRGRVRPRPPPRPRPSTRPAGVPAGPAPAAPAGRPPVPGRCCGSASPSSAPISSAVAPSILPRMSSSPLRAR